MATLTSSEHATGIARSVSAFDSTCLFFQCPLLNLSTMSIGQIAQGSEGNDPRFTAVQADAIRHSIGLNKINHLVLELLDEQQHTYIPPLIAGGAAAADL